MLNVKLINSSDYYVPTSQLSESCTRFEFVNISHLDFVINLTLEIRI